MSDFSNLKYATVANVGDVIKAFDFFCREDRFVIGKVEAKGMTPNGYAGYTIRVRNDSDMEVGPRGRVGQVIFVPFEIGGLEWEGRVQRVITSHGNYEHVPASVRGLC